MTNEFRTQINEIAKAELDPIQLSEALLPLLDELVLMPEVAVEGYLSLIKKTLGVNGDFIRALRGDLRAMRKAMEKPPEGEKEESQEPIEIIETLEPWEEPVKGDDLLVDLQSTINSHAVLDEPSSVACPLWVLLTYCFDAFRILAMLGITSPVKRCGKTTLLEILHGLAKGALLASNITPSAVFRTIEKYKPCLLIDEADTFLKNNDELRGIINSGHTRTSAFIVRTNTETLEPERFSTWGPKALSMIEESRIFDTYLRFGMNALSQEQRALMIDQDTLGGYLIAPSSVRNTILTKAKDQCYALQLSHVEFLADNVETLPLPMLADDVSDFEFTNELGTRTLDEDMDFSLKVLRPHPCAKRLKVSNRFLRKAPSAMEFCQNRLAYKYAITLEKSWMEGTGVNHCLEFSRRATAE